MYGDIVAVNMATPTRERSTPQPQQRGHFTGRETSFVFKNMRMIHFIALGVVFSAGLTLLTLLILHELNKPKN